MCSFNYAMFSDEEYPNYVGWGHSTWQEALKLASRVNVARPVLFHHDPNRTDDDLDELARQAEARHGGALVAREGMLLTL